MNKNILTFPKSISFLNYFSSWKNKKLQKLCQSSLSDLKNKRNYSQSLNNEEEFFKKFFCIGQEVQNALNEKKPIVALESALITNGLEYPINIKVAKKLQEIIRNNGAVPATITILDGKIRVGIDNKELERIAEPNNQKCSLRDLANCLIQKKIGGTTVAATMWIANKAGIKIFSTGGIGGVHRGALDISADLVELGRCPVAVVCAGVKSILDIGKTLEFLETQGVNVLVHNKKPNFPGFFIPQTEFIAPHCTESMEEISDIIVCSQQLGLQKGILIACPIPIENKERSDFVEKAINQALNEANSKNIFGKEVTPFLLQRVAELSGGESVILNISLLENNAKIAAQLANLYDNKIKNINNMEDKRKAFSIFFPSNQLNFQKEYSFKSEIKNKKRPLVICIGGSIVDIEVLKKENLNNSPKIDISSYLPSNIIQRAGGVARNHAEALARLGIDVVLLSAFGTDLEGQPDLGANFLLKKLEKLKNLGIQQGYISADEIISQINCEYIDKMSNLFDSADFLLIDANLTSEAIKRIHYWAKQLNTKIWLEPTNSLKIPKIFDALGDWPLTKIDIFSPNLNELRSFSDYFSQRVGKNEAKECKDFIYNLEENLSTPTINSSTLNNIKLPKPLQPKKHLLITCDRFGVLVFSRLNNKFNVEYLEAPKINEKEICSVSGAGDW
uniref:PfkB domain-containing protein n=1 Tax=Meloidogyne hapla TaxID=6305 RepID=A0A1I8AZC9_MELHA